MTAPRPAAHAQHPPDELALLLGRMMGLVHRRWAGDTLAIMHDAGLSMAQMVALHVLGSCEAQSLSSLAGLLRLSPPATSHLVDRLVQQGLCARAEDALDRRQKKITITTSGKDLITRIAEEHLHGLTEVVRGLSSGLRRQFATVVQEFVDEISAQSPNPDKRKVP